MSHVLNFIQCTSLSFVKNKQTKTLESQKLQGFYAKGISFKKGLERPVAFTENRNNFTRFGYTINVHFRRTNHEINVC
ncbi:hypothetical protein LMOh7858_1835 [Listeria monocytogenes str. 4b H7858]|nr:hypothetical protein LMOh7858_1835 [Listeria monocytogenes str. 4b H7858] [Listeria monocytogenes serotype 4b str. H7858]